MKPTSLGPKQERGLLANGTARAWYVALDEPPDGGPWTLELDGPQAYIVFQLRDTGVVGRAARLLQSALKPGGPSADADLLLGHFGGASVSLVRDDEDFSRCFLIVGPRAKSTLRLSLFADDMRSLASALREVAREIPARA